VEKTVSPHFNFPFFILTPDCRIVLYRDTNSGVKFTSGPSGSRSTSYPPSTMGSPVEEYWGPQRKLWVLRRSFSSNILKNSVCTDRPFQGPLVRLKVC